MGVDLDSTEDVPMTGTRRIRIFTAMATQIGHRISANVQVRGEHNEMGTGRVPGG